MSDVRFSDGRGGWLRLKVMEDANGHPIFATSIPNTTQQTVQIGEATYAARIPNINGVFVQPDLSGGVGKRTQVPSQDPAGFTSYHYADGVDASIPQQWGPGPATTTITKLTNGGPLTGSLELGGNLYLIASRIIAAYNVGTGAITQVADLGAGAVGYGGCTMVRDGAEASDQTATGTGATNIITGPTVIPAQKVTPTVSRDLGRVDLQLVRTDVTAVHDVVIGATGGTFTLAYGAGVTSALAWNVSVADVQTALRGLAGLAAVTVAGIATTRYQVTFTGVVGPALLLVGNPASLTGGTQTVLVTQARVGQAVIGNVELAVQMDYNGHPAMADSVVATLDAAGLSTTAATASFRLDDADSFFQEINVPYWLALRVIGATKDATVGWTRGTSGTQNGLVSGDLGNSWAASYSHYYTTYSKALTPAAFVGLVQGNKFLYTSDGTTYTADTTHEGKHLVVWGNLLIRDCGGASPGAISWSSDGLNWSEPLLIGADPAVPITNLIAMPYTLLVAKEDSLWAVNPTDDPPEPGLVYMAGGRSTSNGVGACVWRGDAFVPFDGKLALVAASFSYGVLIFDVKQSIGPESATEWDSPFGAGRVVACAGDRQCLYAAMSTPSSYKLFKSYAPVPVPPATSAAWHGAIADLGTASALTHMKVFDQGDATSPLLFCSTTNDDLLKIILPRTRVPWADAAYQVSTATGKLYHPWASGNAQINDKAWLTVSQTFAKEAAGGYVDEMWDDLDGAGWRALENGRLYRTGELPMPVGLASKILKRQTRITAGSATVYPILAASGLTYAVRPPERLRQFTFTLDAEDNLSGQALGDMLGMTGQQISADMFLAATGTSGTRLFEDVDGKQWRLLIINATDTMIDRREGAKRAAVEVTGVSQ